MTLIVLAVLATAWLGYFALWFRDRWASRQMRSDAGTSQYFDPSFEAANRPGPASRPFAAAGMWPRCSLRWL